MQTACPHCNTIFRLTDTQMRMAGGVVRCGVCKQTFNALHPEPAKTDKSGTPDLFDHSVFEPAARDVIPQQLRDADQRASIWSGIAWSLAIVLLALALVAEYAWFNRNELQQHAELKPWLEKFCQYAYCQLEPLRDTDKIEMLSRNVYTHPNTRNALMVAVTMANRADHAQPWPDVKIAFSNVRGGTVAARRFTPAEYSSDPATLSALLPSNTEVSFTLEIQDPGKDALTYEFSFL